MTAASGRLWWSGLVAGTVACGGAARDASDCVGAEKPTIVGMWVVLGYVDARGSPRDSTTVAGAPRPASGYVVYDAGGHLLAQVVHAPAPAASRHDWASAPQEQLVELLRGQTAFHGTYVVDTAARRVVHRVVHESPPGPGAYEQVLPYRIDGDTLRIGSAEERQWVLRRVSPPRRDAERAADCAAASTATDGQDCA